MRNRSVAFVIRDKKILMEKLHYGGRYFNSIPGGGIEEGETPEQAVLRELKEECGLEGTIVKKLAQVHSQGRIEYAFEVSVPESQQPIVGYDPEEVGGEQAIKDVFWISLEEMSEKDRAFLWGYGLMQIEGFFETVLSWGDEISYPGK